MNSNQDEPTKKPTWQNSLWVLGMAGQAGLYIALPVILGVFLGFWLDDKLNTKFLFVLLFTMGGFIGGVFLIYRWVKDNVQKRLEEMKQDDESGN